MKNFVFKKLILTVAYAGKNLGVSRFWPASEGGGVPRTPENFRKFAKFF